MLNMVIKKFVVGVLIVGLIACGNPKNSSDVMPHPDEPSEPIEDTPTPDTDHESNDNASDSNPLGTGADSPSIDLHGGNGPGFTAIDHDLDGFTGAMGDCDDNNPLIHPDASDTCADGIDQDCSGLDAHCEDMGGDVVVIPTPPPAPTPPPDLPDGPDGFELPEDLADAKGDHEDSDDEETITANYKGMSVLRGVDLNFGGSDDGAYEIAGLYFKLIDDDFAWDGDNDFSLAGHAITWLIADAAATPYYSSKVYHSGVAYNDAYLWHKTYFCNNALCIINAVDNSSRIINTIPAADLGVPNPSQKKFFAILRGVTMANGDHFGVGAENLWANVQIVDSAMNPTSQLGSDGNLRIKGTCSFKGPVTAQDYTCALHYDIIASDPNVWGDKYFSWSGSGESAVYDSSSHIYIKNHTLSIPDFTLNQNKMFVGLYRWGFRHNRSGTFEFNRLRGYAKIANVSNSNHTVTVQMKGAVHGHNGFDANATSDYLTPNEMKGLLFYCRATVPDVCQVRHSQTTDAGNASTQGDYLYDMPIALENSDLI